MNITTDTTAELYIIKRDGRKELLDINKVHKMTEAACNGLTGVSSSQVEMNSGLQFSDGMSTNDIQEVLIKSAPAYIAISEAFLTLSKVSNSPVSNITFR